MKARQILTGAAAGASTGLLVGGFLVPVLILTQQSLSPFASSGQGNFFSLTAPTIVGVLVLMIVTTAVFAALLLSLIGILFVGVEKWVPGGSLNRKSTALFVVLWLVAFVFRFPAYLRGYSSDLLILETILLVWVLLCSQAFAYFFGRFSRK